MGILNFAAAAPRVLRARQFQRRHFAAALVYLAVAVALPAAVIRRVRALSDDSSEDPKKVSISIAYRVAAWVSWSFCFWQYNINNYAWCCVQECTCNLIFESCIAL